MNLSQVVTYVWLGQAFVLLTILSKANSQQVCPVDYTVAGTAMASSPKGAKSYSPGRSESEALGV
jgi:hypothetical protein